MFADALAAYKARQSELTKESARATAAAKRAARELTTTATAQQNVGAEQVFHRQERVGAELKAIRKAATAADKDVATLSRAVHDLEKQTLLFGDLEHYLGVIVGQIEGIAVTLGRIQAAQQARQAAQRQQAGSGGASGGAPPRRRTGS